MAVDEQIASPLVVCLQNAWRRGAVAGQRQFMPDKSPEISHRAWRWALHQSRSGQRLRQILPAGLAWHEVEFIEASPLIGAQSHDRFPFEPDHFRAELERTRPRVLMLMGKEAAKGLTIGLTFTPYVISTWHPTYRLLSTDMVSGLRGELAGLLEAAHAD